MNDAKNKKEEKKSLDRPINWRSLTAFALPTIVSMVFMNIYGSVDGAFVSNLISTDALSAVNIVFPLLILSMAVGTMFSTGGNAIVAKMLGEKREDEARRFFSLILIAAFALAAVLSVLGYVFLEPLLRFFGADDKLYPYCEEYATVILGMMPVAIFSMVFQGFFITSGKAHLALFFSIAGGMINVALDYILIAVAELGMTGAAVATGAGYSFSALMGLLYFTFRRKNILRIVRPKFDIKIILHSCANGSSEMVTSLSAAVVTLMFNRIMMDLAGSDGVSSITIVLYMMGLLSAAYLGYSIGIAPIVSYNYGKGDRDKLRKIFRVSLAVIGVFSALTFGLSMALASPLVSIFSAGNATVHEMAVTGFRLFAAAFLFMGFNVFSSALFTALSNGIVSAVLSIFRTLIFVVAAMLTLPMIFGVNGVFVANPIAEFLGIIMSVIFFRIYGKRYGFLGKPADCPIKELQ